MQMKQLKTGCLLLLLLSFCSCKKEVADPSFTDTPVVQGYLEPGTTPILNISRQVAFSSTATYAPDNINALNVQIIYNDTVYTMKPLGNGNYVDSNLFISKNGTYGLRFAYNGKTVSATTSIPPKPTGYSESTDTMSIVQEGTGATGGGGGLGGYRPNPFIMSWSNPDASYYIIVVENIEVNPVAINLNETAPPRIFRNQPTQSNQYQINSREFHFYGRHRMILYHLNPDYASLYNNDGSSSLNLTNPQTNLTNGLGIFTGLNADTLMVTIYKPL